MGVISEPTCLDANCCFKWALQRFFVGANASLEGKRNSPNQADPREFANEDVAVEAHKEMGGVAWPLEGDAD